MTIVVVITDFNACSKELRATGTWVGIDGIQFEEAFTHCYSFGISNGCD